jgi:primosomal protein N'
MMQKRVITWDEMNELFYQKFPHLKELSCGVCGQIYRDFPKCPTCGHSRKLQLKEGRFVWARVICWLFSHIWRHDLSNAPDCDRCGEHYLKYVNARCR